MPGYELSVMFKVLARPDLSAAMKRVGTLLLDQGTILQKIENHGTRDLAMRMNKNDQPFNRGSFYVYHFVSTRNPFADIKEECSRDVDVLKFGIVSQQKEFHQRCTLDAELKCPAYRKSVRMLMEKGVRLKRKTKLHYARLKEFKYFDNYM